MCRLWRWWPGLDADQVVGNKRFECNIWRIVGCKVFLPLLSYCGHGTWGKLDLGRCVWVGTWRFPRSVLGRIQLSSYIYLVYIYIWNSTSKVRIRKDHDKIIEEGRNGRVQGTCKISRLRA